MRIELLKKLEGLVVEETPTGFKLVGFKQSILPLGMAARIKYKKKLKSRRLLKKYAKKLLIDVINSFVKERLNDKSKASCSINEAV